MQQSKKTVSIKDVAAYVGLSVGTVSKYINGKTVKESTRLAIEEAIKELDFHPNNIAKGLRNAKSFSVAILLPMLDSTFWRRNYKKWRQHQNHYDY